MHQHLTQYQGKNPYAPFSNASTYGLTKWWFNGGNQSLKGFDSLVDDVLLAPDFCLDDLEDNAAAELKKPSEFETVVIPGKLVKIHKMQATISVNVSAVCWLVYT